MSVRPAIARRDLLKGVGYLLVACSLSSALHAAEPSGPWPKIIPDDRIDSWLAVKADGGVTCFTGRVDLGTGIRTALAQIVADELDVDLDRVTMVMGDTARTPDQGTTSASNTIQSEAIPIRHAAADARQMLLKLASDRLGVAVSDLRAASGIITSGRAGKSISYGELIGDKRFDLRASGRARTKKPSEYTVVGKSVPRTDIAAKATGSFTFVHDIRRPGMLHARVIRPPATGSETAVGASLAAVDMSSVRHIPGIVRVVRIEDFLGVVAEREENAVRAARELKVEWKPWSAMPDFAKLEAVLRDHPSKPRVLREEGDIRSAFANAAIELSATYIWPYQMHASIGPSCAVAEFAGNNLTIWSATQSVNAIRREAAQLLVMPEEAVRVIHVDGAGCYGLNCADDVSLDAALLSKAVDRPVRVQLSREQEQGWEPKGAAQLMDVRGSLDGNGRITGYQFTTKCFSGRAETLAHYLTGAKPAKPAVLAQGDRNAVPPYSGISNLQVNVLDLVPPVRAARMRGVASLPNSFAHECFIDELAVAAGVDPLKFRLERLNDPRARRRAGGGRQEGGLGAACAPQAGARRRHDRQGARHRLCALHPRGLSGIRGRVHGLGRGRGGRSRRRRGPCHPGGGGAGRRPDGQPERRRAAGVRQRDPVGQPRPDGGGQVRRRGRDQPRFPQLSDRDLPRMCRTSKSSSSIDRTIRRSGSAKRPRSRAPPPSPTPSSMRPAPASGRCRSRRDGSRRRSPRCAAETRTTSVYSRARNSSRRKMSWSIGALHSRSRKRKPRSSCEKTESPAFSRYRMHTSLVGVAASTAFLAPRVERGMLCAPRRQQTCMHQRFHGASGKLSGSIT